MFLLYILKGLGDNMPGQKGMCFSNELSMPLIVVCIELVGKFGFSITAPYGPCSNW